MLTGIEFAMTVFSQYGFRNIYKEMVHKLLSREGLLIECSEIESREGTNRYVDCPPTTYTIKVKAKSKVDINPDLKLEFLDLVKNQKNYTLEFKYTDPIY